MRQETRFKFNAYLTQLAKLNGISVDDVSKKFTVEPSVTQTLMNTVQASSAFLQTINILPVAEMKGEKIGVGVTGTIASTTDTSGDDERKTADFTALESNKYECNQINFDFHLTYKRLDLWARFQDFQRRIRDGHFVGRSVILGATENGSRLAQHMQQNVDIASGLLGFIDDRSPDRIASNLRPQLIGNFALLEQLIRNNEVDQVLMALPAAAEGRNHHYVELLRKMPVQVFLVPEMQAFNFALPRVADISDVPMLVVSEPPLKGWAPAYKRAEDVVLASLALLLLSPLMLLVAVAIKLDSRGPVLFRQRRYGYNHQLIEVYKFRSMFHDLRDMDAQTQTRAGDPRVTRIGRFIRKSSIDELPQLFNVLAGSMSMVGPRPHATATKAADILFEEAVANYVARHKVKPGITGLAQVHGYRGETDTVEKLQKRVEYDLAYIENWSLGLDAFILLRTLPAVLSMKAAY